MHADRHGCPEADGLKIANECYQGKLIVLWVASGRSGLYIGRASHGRDYRQLGTIGVRALPVVLRHRRRPGRAKPYRLGLRFPLNRVPWYLSD